MTTIDLGPSSPAQPDEPWAGVPRRVGLTLAELRHACRLVDAPLPFDVVESGPASGLEDRLGQSRTSAQDAAFAEAAATLGDPASSLARRGLVVDEELDAGISGALGLLATPEVAVDLDVAVDDLRGHAWHRQKGDAVATLATTDGLLFELAWFPTAGWAAELGRAAGLPEDCGLRPSQVPDHLEVPFALADSVLEALRSGRDDLVPVLASGDATLISVLTALATEAHGRLRAIVAPVTAEGSAPIGIVSWTLVDDGWRAMRPTVRDDEATLVLTRVEPSDLAAELAPVLAEVAR